MISFNLFIEHRTNGFGLKISLSVSRRLPKNFQWSIPWCFIFYFSNFILLTWRLVTMWWSVLIAVTSSSLIKFMLMCSSLCWQSYTQIEQLNNWKVWHRVIQNQLEISRKVVICFNGFIAIVLWTFPGL